MTTPVTEADREAARGLLTARRLNYYIADEARRELPGFADDVETAAQVIADARKRERDERLRYTEVDPTGDPSSPAGRGHK